MVRTRLEILIVLIALPFFGILWRISALQLDPVLHQSYTLQSQHRSRRFARPERGRILARDGKTVLAGNRSVFSLNFTYRALNPRQKPLSILIEELPENLFFPPGREKVTEVLRRLGNPRALARTSDTPAAQWQPLVQSLDLSTAANLERRLSRYRDVFEVRYPQLNTDAAEIWFCPRRALQMEITLYRLAELLSGPGELSLESTFQRLLARVSEVLKDIEKRVEREAKRDLAREIRASVVKKATRYRRGLYYDWSWALQADVSMATVTAIEYHPARFPGVLCMDELRRHYPLKDICGTLTGYLRPLEVFEGRISTLTEEGRLLDAKARFDTVDDFRRARKRGFRRTDRVGISGLERMYDGHLRGLHGMSIVSVDQHGKPRVVLDELPAENGQDLLTTIDAPLQVLLFEELERALNSRSRGSAASAAVMEVHSGALLASVSYPGVDPNRPWERSYVTDMNARWGKQSGWRLDGPSRRPLFPGSIFKIIVAAGAAESSSGYTPAQRYPCHHKFDRIPQLSCGSKNGHTPDRTVNLAEALQFSCNNYFYYLALDHLKAEGLFRWGHRFGLGRPTGLDLGTGGLATGRLDPPVKAKRKTSACQYAIGQVHVEATPLQVLRVIAAIAEGGRHLQRPYLSTESEPEDLGLSATTVEVLREGMWRVAHARSGTASAAEFGLHRFNVALKTGTAEVQVGSETLHNAWLVGFAPFENPYVAFVAVVEKTSLHGAEACAPVVRKLLEYLANQRPEAYRLEPSDSGEAG